MADQLGVERLKLLEDFVAERAHITPLRVEACADHTYMYRG